MSFMLIFMLAFSVMLAIPLVTVFWRPLAWGGTGRFFQGMGLQFLLAMPAGIAQAIVVMSGVGGSPIWLRLLLPLIAAPFNMGGWTVRVLFEATVLPIMGKRQDTVLSNWPLWMTYLLVQTAIISTVYTIRTRERRPYRDPVLIVIGVLFLLNSLVNVSWPWWGS